MNEYRSTVRRGVDVLSCHCRAWRRLRELLKTWLSTSAEDDPAEKSSVQQELDQVRAGPQEELDQVGAGPHCSYTVLR